MEQIKYNIYPSLLDKFQNYLDSEKDFNKYGDAVGCSYDDWMQRKTTELIDAINRVPFESEAANRGTAFNELVDALISGKKVEVIEGKNEFFYKWKYKETSFNFPVQIAERFAFYYATQGAISQEYCEAVINTSFGRVRLYGYIDELLPHEVHDIKTTKHYTRGKYFNKWQRFVYPYCLSECGCIVKSFIYAVTDFKNTYIEEYNYNHETDAKILRDYVERFITFLEVNKKLIHDRKIFNYRYGKNK